MSISVVNNSFAVPGAVSSLTLNVPSGTVSVQCPSQSQPRLRGMATSHPVSLSPARASTRGLSRDDDPMMGEDGEMTESIVPPQASAPRCLLGRIGILALCYFVVVLYQGEARRMEPVLGSMRPAESGFISPIAVGIRERDDAAKHQFLFGGHDSAMNFFESEIFVFKPCSILRRAFTSAENIIRDFDQRSLSVVRSLWEFSGSRFPRIGEFQSRPEFMNYCRSLAAIPQDEDHTHFSFYGWMKIRCLNKNERSVYMKRGFRNSDSGSANPDRYDQQHSLEGTYESEDAGKGRYAFLYSDFLFPLLLAFFAICIEFAGLLFRQSGRTYVGCSLVGCAALILVCDFGSLGFGSLLGFWTWICGICGT